MDLNREETRGFWESSGMSYEDISNHQLIALKNEIQATLILNPRMGGKLKCDENIKMRFCPKTGALISAAITCSSHYFGQREAITFNKGGFIGLCGWADYKNSQPFLKGFTNWLECIT